MHLNSKRPIQLKINKQISQLGVNSQIKYKKQSPDHQLKSSIIKQLRSPSEESLTRRKKNTISHPQNSQNLQKKELQYQIVHSELNTYIDQLDTKVTKLIQNQQAQFLIAYRNHTKKVNKQMEQIKNKALLNANSIMNHTEKIQCLEKQLALFREESLKLFEKNNQKQKIIRDLNIRISQLQSEKSFLQTSLKSLTKRNKQLQGLKNNSLNKKYETVDPTGDKQFLITRPPRHQSSTQQLYSIDFNYTPNTFKSRPFTTAINSKAASVKVHNRSMPFNLNYKYLANQFIDQREKIIDKIDVILKDQVSQETILSLKTSILEIIRPKQHIQPGKDLLSFHETGTIKLSKQSSESRQVRRTLSKRSRNHFQSKIHARKSELQEYFYKSIEAVRKQIIRRRGLKAINFYNQYANLGPSQFKTIDFFRLLQLLLSHDKIIQAVHNSIFQISKQYMPKKSPEKF